MSFNTFRYLIITTDPVRIGTGGMRLGRVDNTIVREPGTNLPKIPGTALHGAIRAYSARRYGKSQCAGQGSKEVGKHCGRPTCPICYTFGSIQGGSDSFSGVVSITDARILLFPVYSMVGPVWVSTREILKETDFNFKVKDKNNKHQETQKDETEKAFLTWDRNDPINLGWLMLNVAGKVDVNLPEKLKDKVSGNDIKEWQTVKNRIVIVPPKVFSQIVNSNLEVRTSTTINPETGAVEEGALFTYEAIPRATFLWFDVIVDDFRNVFPTKKLWTNYYERIKSETLPEEFQEDTETKIEQMLRQIGYVGNRPQEPEKKDEESVKKYEDSKKNYWEKVKNGFKALKDVMENGIAWNHPIDIINLGLEWAEHLGIGGMGTRGFGRIKTIFCLKLSSDNKVECKENKNESS